jgi:nucleotide-binding universal stress UspA family protein
MEFKRILVAINSLNGRDAAFERALALARAGGAELYLLHAVPVNERFSFRAAERLERMADMRRRAEDAGVRVQTVEQHGDAGEIIELHANARDVDLIVMGGEPRRGWRGRRSVVAERVIRRTAVPTLVVPSDGAGTPAAFRNVLVALDLSPASTQVLEGAVGVTAHEAAQLTVVHTVPGVEAVDAVQTPARWAVPEYRTHLRGDARRTLEAVVSAVPVGVPTRVRVAAGSAATVILDHAVAADADLIVVGRSRGLKMLGSTAVRVLRQSDVALLVIPNAAGTGRLERQRAA